MKKGNYFFLLIVLAAIFNSCARPVKGSNGVVYKTVVDYNNYIIDRQKILIKNIVDFVKVSQTDLDSAENMMDENSTIITGLINDIKGMPPYKGDTLFRNAGINLFVFYKNLFGNEYKRLIEIRRNGGDSDPAQQNELNNIVDGIAKDEEMYDKIFHNAQKDFAEKNNMRLSENK